MEYVLCLQLCNGRRGIASVAQLALGRGKEGVEVVLGRSALLATFDGLVVVCFHLRRVHSVCRLVMLLELTVVGDVRGWYAWIIGDVNSMIVFRQVVVVFGKFGTATCKALYNLTSGVSRSALRLT